jgi:hypothetical protein
MEESGDEREGKRKLEDEDYHKPENPEYLFFECVTAVR